MFTNLPRRRPRKMKPRKALVTGGALMDIEPNPRKPVNIGNPEEYTVEDVASLVLKLTRSNATIVFRPLPSDDPQCRRPDITQAQELLGWMPQISVERGLSETISWFRREIQPTMFKGRVSPSQGTIKIYEDNSQFTS